MVDPDNVTNFNPTAQDLEELIVFWVLAAGKNGHRAAQIAHKLRMESDKCYYGRTLNYIRVIGEGWLASELKSYGSGCHNQKAHTLLKLAEANFNLYKCTLEELESIKGIGRKTSRCFILHSRPDQQLAGLDTHLLKWLKSKGYDVPKTTPSSLKKYNEITEYFLTEARKAGKTPAEMDLEIWKSLRVLNTAKKAPAKRQKLNMSNCSL